MSRLVYAIAEADGLGVSEANDLAISGSGLDGRPLRAIVEPPLLAAVSDHDGPAPEPTAAALAAWERTVRGLMELGAILPAQFASVLGDDFAVRTLLRERAADLLARLRSVRGAVEIGLRASWSEAALVTEVAPSSGTSYLRNRLELRQSARRVASELDPLAALARSSRRAIVPQPDLPVLDAYLVDRGRVNEFVALVEQIDGRLDDVELVCTGPWPPYSFAQGAPV